MNFSQSRLGSISLLNLLCHKFVLQKFILPFLRLVIKTNLSTWLKFLNFNKFFLKTLRLVALRRLGSNMFHSITLDGKNFFFEKVMFSVKKSHFICIFWHCNLNFLLVLDWKGKLVYFLCKFYKISKVSCTNTDVGGIPGLIHGKFFLLTIF